MSNIRVLIERILEREHGIAFNLLERVDPENYINNLIQEISLDKIDNMPSGASASPIPQKGIGLFLCCSRSGGDLVFKTINVHGTI